MVSSKLALILIVSLGLTGACAKSKFTGKSQAAVPEVPKTSNSNPPSSTDTPLPSQTSSNAPPSTATTELIKACTDNAAKLQTVTQAMTFPERLGCSWNQNGNLGEVQEHVQAREDQVLTLNLPAGTLCSMDVTTAGTTKSIRYDDFLILTIDDHVLLASNKELLTSMKQDGGVYLWDFENIKGKGIDWNAGRYCLGSDAKDCKVPATEQLGVFDLTMQPEAIAPISTSISGKASVPFTLTSTGDNDPDKDCAHTQIDLNVNMRYLPK